MLPPPRSIGGLVVLNVPPSSDVPLVDGSVVVVIVLEPVIDAPVVTSIEVLPSVSVGSPVDVMIPVVDSESSLVVLVDDVIVVLADGSVVDPESSVVLLVDDVIVVLAVVAVLDASSPVVPVSPSVVPVPSAVLVIEPVIVVPLSDALPELLALPEFDVLPSVSLPALPSGPQ